MSDLWGDDEWSDRIKAAFPTQSGAHEEWRTALEMVHNRHSKGSLVALVTWLLVELRAARAATGPEGQANASAPPPLPSR